MTLNLFMNYSGGDLESPPEYLKRAFISLWRDSCFVRGSCAFAVVEQESSTATPFRHLEAVFLHQEEDFPAPNKCSGTLILFSTT